MQLENPKHRRSSGPATEPGVPIGTPNHLKLNASDHLARETKRPGQCGDIGAAPRRSPHWKDDALRSAETGYGLRPTSAGTRSGALFAVPYVTPDSSWNGQPNSGGAAPALDTSRQGSGFDFKPVANIFEEDGAWVGWNGLDDPFDMEITIQAITGDPDGIKEIRIYGENSTPVILTERSFNERTRTFGYSFIPQSRNGANGEANFTIDVVPYNGFIRRLPVFTLTLNTSLVGKITRPEIFVATAADATYPGSNSNSGTATSPYLNINYAFLKATDALNKGAIIRCRPGTYVEANNRFGALSVNANSRKVHVTTLAGQPQSSVRLDYAGREHVADNLLIGCYQPWIINYGFYNIEINTANMVFFYCYASADVRASFKNCLIKDFSGGAGGPNFSDPAYDVAWRTGGDKNDLNTAPLIGTGYWGIAQNFFRNREGQRVFVMETLVDMYVFTGWLMLRNVDIKATYDVAVLGAALASDNMRMANVWARINNPWPQPRHKEETVALASATYDSTKNATVLLFAGSPTMTANPFDQPFSAYKFLTGANVGAGNTTGTFNEAHFWGGFHLQAQNRSFLVDVTAAGPAVVTAYALSGVTHVPTAHRLVAGTPITFTSTGTLPAGISPATTYYVIATGMTTNTFQFSATFGGAAVTTTDTGTGDHTAATPAGCAIVSGNCSTATGGSAVGDLLRGYIIAHCDPLQYLNLLSTDQGPSNLLIQNYTCEGWGIGNGWLLQTSSAGIMPPNTLTITTDNTDFTTSIDWPNLRPGDFIKLVNGSQRGECARVLTYSHSMPFAGTISSPFSVDQTSGTTVPMQVKAATDVAFINMTVGWPADPQWKPLYQWQGGMTNFILESVTLVGNPVQGVSLADFTFRNTTTGTWNNSWTSPSGLPAPACSDGFYVRNSIFESMSAENPSLFPNSRVVIDNNHFRRTGQGSNKTTGVVSFDTNWSPDFASSDHLVLPPYIPWQAQPPNGVQRIRTNLDPVGARPFFDAPATFDSSATKFDSTLVTFDRTH